jgi:flagellin
MPVNINNNAASLKASAFMDAHRMNLDRSMAKLASGSRTQNAGDDAAAAGIAAKLLGQAKAFEQSALNAQAGMALAAIADSALVEIQNMATRIQELGVVAGSGQFTTNDQANATAEITALNAEIARIAGAATFNTMSVSGQTFNLTISGSDTTTAFAIPTIPTAGGTDAATAATALTTIATARGTLGAFVNRLEYATNSLNAQAANTYAAYSTVNDADMAKESAAVAKGQVLMQASAAVLAQANATPQYALMFLQ